ncbi:MAG: DUF2530 domain-containing protein [Propionibacteriaceae bacterium]|nr:DUF2530 domain-containing protein [Propionibacteriaceae bacterium]
MNQIKPVLMQAPVKALDPDGKLVLAIGSGGFGVATVVCLALYGELAVSGQLWRLWVALTGLGLGLLALAIVWWRRRGTTR